MFKISKKTIVGSAIGNALEIYDYAIWAIFSVSLTKEFLPPQSQISDIFFLFLITYFLRPIGSLICGILSDQLGRKRILIWSIVLMGLCTSIIGVLPSYKQIGIISVFLLLFIRLLQVFSAGGEYISSISLLIESCEKNNRGYYGSWAAFGVNTGMLFASLVGALLFYAINNHFIPDWGWRLAFVISFVTMLVGFWIRNSIPESFEFITENSRNEKRLIYDILKEALYTIRSRAIDSLMVFFLVLFGTCTTILIFVYAVIHMTTINSLINHESLLINSISLGLLIILIPIFGVISDYYGRVKTLSFSIVSLLTLIVPYFYLISTGSFYQVLIAHIIIGIPCSCIFSLTPTLISEIFPLSVRCSVTGLIYSFAVCFGGGITPIVAIALGKSVYGNFAPSILILISGSVCIIALIITHCRKKVGPLLRSVLPTHNFGMVQNQ